MQTSIRPTTRRAGRAMILVLAVGVVVGVQSAPASATTYSENRMATLINGARSAAGVPKLSLNQTLSTRAREHSKAMAAKKSLYHSCLTCMLSGLSWSAGAENIAYGYSMEGVHKAFLNSAVHKVNEMNRAYKQVGVGVHWVSGKAWVTVVFYG